MRAPSLRFLAAVALVLAFAAVPCPTRAQGSGLQPLKQALEAPVKSKVLVRGTLMSKSAPDPNSSQPWSLYVKDNSGSARVVIFLDCWNQISGREMFEPGVSLDLYGEVTDFRGSRQLTVAKPNHIRITPGSRPPDSAFADEPARADGDQYEPVTIGSIDNGAIGRNVRVRGTAVEVEPSAGPRVPTKVTLKDTTGEIIVVFWTDVEQKLTDANRPMTGQPFEAAGKVSEYKGKMQLKVFEAANLTRPAGGSSSAPPPAGVPGYHP